MYSIRNEVGPDYEKKTTYGRLPLGPNIPMANCTPIQMVWFPSKLAAEGPRRTANCARSQKPLITINDRELLIQTSHNKATCKGPHSILRLLPTRISTKASQRYCSRQISSLPSTTGLSAVRYLCPLRLERRPCLIWSCLRKEKKFRDSSL